MSEIEALIARLILSADRILIGRLMFAVCIGFMLGYVVASRTIPHIDSDGQACFDLYNNRAHNSDGRLPFDPEAKRRLDECFDMLTKAGKS